MTGPKTIRKLPLWGTILTFLGLIILCGLGGWQLQRLEWKQNTLNQLEEAYEGNGAAGIFQHAFTGGKFIYGTAEGTFLPDKAIKLGPRSRDGAISHDLIVPLIVGEQTLFVNLGFNHFPDQPPPIDAYQGQTIQFEGLARAPDWNSFTPDNKPDEGLWYKADLEQMAAAKDLPPPHAYMLYAERASVKFDAQFPNNQRWSPNNNHLQYAFFWFGMALALVVVYLLRFVVIKPKK